MDVVSNSVDRFRSLTKSFTKENGAKVVSVVAPLIVKTFCVFSEKSCPFDKDRIQWWSAFSASFVIFGGFCIRQFISHGRRMDGHDRQIASHAEHLTSIDMRLDSLEDVTREMQRQLIALGGSQAARVRESLLRIENNENKKRVYHEFLLYLTCLHTASYAISSGKIQPAPNAIAEKLSRIGEHIPGPKFVKLVADIYSAYDKWKRKEEARRVVECFLHVPIPEIAMQGIACKLTEEFFRERTPSAIQGVGDRNLFNQVKERIDLYIRDENSRFNDMFELRGDFSLENQALNRRHIGESVPQEPTNISHAPSIAFGKEKWKWFGDIGNEPPFPANIENILASRCPFWPGKQVKDTHMLILIPRSVKLKEEDWIFSTDLNFEGLEKIAGLRFNEKKGTDKWKYNRSVLDKYYEDRPTHRTHWILMTKEFIPGSYDYFEFDSQRALLKEYMQWYGSEVEYTFPSPLEAAICIFAKSAGQGHLIDAPYTRCTRGIGIGGTPFIEDNFWNVQSGIRAMRILPIP